MHGLVELLKAFFGAPQCQFWLFVGMFVGAIYGLLRRKHRQELFWTTAIVIVPPLIILPSAMGMVASHSDFLIWVAVMAGILYVMTGFVGFCVAWIPGVALGYLFGWAIERPDQNSAKA